MKLFCLKKCLFLVMTLSLIFLFALSYQSDAAEKESVPLNSIIISEKLESNPLVVQYLAGKLSEYYDREIKTIPGDPAPGSIWIGYLDEVPDEFIDSELELNREGFLIKSVQIGEGSNGLIVASESINGMLYASAEIEKQLNITDKPWHTMDIQDEPAFEHRNVWFWTTMSLTADYFTIGHMRDAEQHQKFIDLVDLLIQMRVNAITLWGRIGEEDTGVGRFTAESLNNFATFLKQYGIEMYVFLLYPPDRYGFDDIMANPERPTICVHDHGVRTFWEQRVDKIYDRIPELAGFVMAGAGGDWVRGPWECTCPQCSKHTHRELVLKATKMIADPMAKHGGKLIYKNVTDRPTMVDVEVELFSNLEGLLPDNVIIAFKNYYNDFRTPYPNNPMFYHLDPIYPDRSIPYITEFQIYGEYRGGQQYLAVMTELWAPQFQLAQETNVRGTMAIASISRDIDHPINMANWYSFGQLSWNPEKDPGELLYEWATLQFGKEAAPYLVDIAKLSIEASKKTFFMKGIRVDNHSRLPSINLMLEWSLVGPWHDLPRNKDGWVGQGNDISMYPEDIQEQILNNQELVLFHSRVPLTSDLVEEGIREKKEAVELVKKMISLWDEAKPYLDQDTYSRIRQGLEKNVVDAMLFKESVEMYLTYKLGEMTRSMLREWLDDINANFSPEDGSSRISGGENFYRFIDEWEEVYEGTFKRTFFPGKHYQPPTSDFPPGFKDE